MAHSMPKASRIDRFSKEGMLKGELVVRARTVIMYAVEGPAGSGLRVSDNGVTNHTTGDRNVYDWVEIPRGKDNGLIGCGKNMRVVGVGRHNLQTHGATDFNAKLPGVKVTEGVGFIHFFVHDGQSRETITSDLFYDCFTFPRDETGSYLHATRLDPTPQTLAAVPTIMWGSYCPLVACDRSLRPFFP